MAKVISASANCCPASMCSSSTAPALSPRWTGCIQPHRKRKRAARHSVWALADFPAVADRATNLRAAEGPVLSEGRRAEVHIAARRRAAAGLVWELAFRSVAEAIPGREARTRKSFELDTASR